MDARSRNIPKAPPAEVDVTPWQPERWPSTTLQAPIANRSYSVGSASRKYYIIRGSARRARLVSWLLYGGIGSLLGVVIAATSSGGGSSQSVTVLPAVLAGVNVCAADDVNASLQGCTAGATEVAAGSGARVCYRAPAIGTFTGIAVSFTIQRIDENGAPLAHGTPNDVVRNAQSAWCSPIDTILRNARLPLTPGTYRMAVQFGAVDLGSATFALTASTT